MDRLLNLSGQIAELARNAGHRILQFYDGRSSVTLKKDLSPLTEADRASHKFLTNSLRSLVDGAAVISEESEEGIYADDSVGLHWLVDPLDGTKEFVKGTNEFTVNIALVERGTPILGVVHAPALDVTYYGGRNLGAWKQMADDTPVSISTRRADLSRMAVVASKDHAGPLVNSMLGRISNPELTSMGSSMKFCLVAEGKADLYLRDLPTMERDTAAAHCIVRAAGGEIYTLDGNPLSYGKPELKNPAIMTIGDATLDWRPLIGEAQC
jgi:3'(2'), 5'-bisphosphate nucleotidase